MAVCGFGTGLACAACRSADAAGHHIHVTLYSYVIDDDLFRRVVVSPLGGISGLLHKLAGMVKYIHYLRQVVYDGFSYRKPAGLCRLQSLRRMDCLGRLLIL